MSRTEPGSPDMDATKHHGLPILPQPTQDERDPLRWPRALRLAALAATAFVNFAANFAASRLSVATPVLQAQFKKSPNQINSLLTVCTHHCLTIDTDTLLVQLFATWNRKYGLGATRCQVWQADVAFDFDTDAVRRSHLVG